jgi:hypothetical protein
VRSGKLEEGREGDDQRLADLARKNGGPGVVSADEKERRRNPNKPLRKAKALDVRRKYAEESMCLLKFYEAMNGDKWVEHNSWQKLLVQLRAPDGSTLELDRVASMSASEITHFRDELHGVRSKWVNKSKLPKLLTQVVELKMPSNGIKGQLPNCLSQLIHLRILEFPENNLTGITIRLTSCIYVKTCNHVT